MKKSCALCKLPTKAEGGYIVTYHILYITLGLICLTRHTYSLKHSSHSLNISLWGMNKLIDIFISK